MIIRKCYEQLYTHKFDNLDEIYPFLEKYKLPQLTQYKTDNLKYSVTIKEIEFVVFKTHPPYQKSPGPDSFTGKMFRSYIKYIQKNGQNRSKFLR